MENADKQIEKVVKDWFEKKAREEWRRLERNPYHQIEFIVTLHFLEKYLPKRGLILDAGGGAGRYTIELAKQGYNVVFLDLVSEMLRMTKRKTKRAGVRERVKEFVQALSRICQFSPKNLVQFCVWEAL
jgi:2-polyprenyl-3-methyl-5-hydroxy-6-metoxy-1,4-benzoquinol methylase